MANYTTSEDLVADILQRGGELTDGTSDYNDEALLYLNRAYQGIWSGGSELNPDIQENWWWLRKDDQGVLTLNPAISAGTISVTNNSTTVTFSSGPTPSVAGYHFKVDDHADVFIISAHVAGATGATLESVYTGETDTTASYRVFQLDYDLATDVLHLNSAMFAFQDGRGEIPGMALEEMRRRFPLNTVSSGVPHTFAMIDQQKVRFSHYGGTTSTDLIKINYEYTREPADLTNSASSVPEVPRQYRKVLADWALFFLFSDKNDNRAADALGLARSGVMAMAGEQRRRMYIASGRMMGTIQPRQSQGARERGPLRTQSGLIIG